MKLYRILQGNILTMNRIIILSAFFCFMIADLISWSAGKTHTQPVEDPISCMITARAGHTATVLSNGMVLITGGMNGDSIVLASAELYDPATDRFFPTGAMTTQRSGHQALLLSNGKVLIIGGLNKKDAILSSTELYDPNTGVFTPAGDVKRSISGL